MGPETLAWACIAAFAFSLLPGYSTIDRPRINWSGPHAYVNIAGSLAGLALAVWTIAA